MASSRSNKQRLVALLLAGELVLMPISGLSQEMKSIRITSENEVEDTTQENQEFLSEVNFEKTEEKKLKDVLKLKVSNEFLFNFSENYDNKESMVESEKTRSNEVLHKSIEIAQEKLRGIINNHVKKANKNLGKQIPEKIQENFKTPSIEPRDIKINLIGTTDILGNPERNMELSIKRAKDFKGIFIDNYLKKVVQETLGIGLISPEQYIQIQGTGVELPTKKQFSKIKKVFKEDSNPLELTYGDLKNKNEGVLNQFYNKYLSLQKENKENIKKILQENRKVKVELEMSFDVVNTYYKIFSSKQVPLEGDRVRGINFGKTKEPGNTDKKGRYQYNKAQINSILKERTGYKQPITRNSGVRTGSHIGGKK